MASPPDMTVLTFFSTLITPEWLDTAMRLWTNSIQPVLFGLSFILLFFQKTRKAGAIGICSMLLSIGLVEGVLKFIFMRPRPYELYEWARLIGPPASTFSFPSGHTSCSFAGATGLSLTLRKRRTTVTLFAAAAFTGFTRIYLSIHWTTDVLAGIFSGILCGLIARRLIKWSTDKITLLHNTPAAK